MKWKTAIFAMLVSVSGAIAHAEPTGIRHGSPSTLEWQPLPEFGGEQSVIYRSTDGSRVATAFRASQHSTLPFTFDAFHQFLVVTSGSAVVRVVGGDTFTLNVGDFAYFPKGAQVEFEFNDGFSDVAMLISDSSANPSPNSGIRHGNPNNLQWQPLPEFGGQESIIYASADGSRIAAAFRESGRHSFTYTFDEFLVVTSGSVVVHVIGGDTITLNTGDYGYFPTGTQVEFEFSDDFSDLTMLVSDGPISW